MTAPLRVRQKPQVISASLGICEPLLKHIVGDNAIFSTEGALEMASASGVTFVASSGDQGSADCPSSSGGILRLLSVNYPSSSWWVTGIGGTNFELNTANAIDQPARMERRCGAARIGRRRRDERALQPAQLPAREHERERPRRPRRLDALGYRSRVRDLLLGERAQLHQRRATAIRGRRWAARVRRRHFSLAGWRSSTRSSRRHTNSRSGSSTPCSTRSHAATFPGCSPTSPSSATTSASTSAIAVPSAAARPAPAMTRHPVSAASTSPPSPPRRRPASRRSSPSA